MRTLIYFVLSFTLSCGVGINTVKAQLNLSSNTSDTIVFNLQKKTWLTPATQFNNARFWGATGISVASFSLTLSWLNWAWYQQYPRTKFHFFDDSGEWLQIDKVGHAWTTYSEAYYAYGVYRWAGLPPKRAALYGVLTGFTYQAGIELLDGYSKKWGASLYDIGANTLGASLFLVQTHLWEEQRIRLKFSSYPPDYSNLHVHELNRIHNLYGTNYTETILKDYNGQTYWLSINPSAFVPNLPLPTWLNMAFGYGGNNIFGGYTNTWVSPNNENLELHSTRSRTRQYYLSLDIDLSRINTTHKGLKLLLDIFNILKFPAPAVMLDSRGKMQAYWLYW